VGFLQRSYYKEEYQSVASFLKSYLFSLRVCFRLIGINSSGLFCQSTSPRRPMIWTKGQGFLTAGLKPRYRNWCYSDDKPVPPTANTKGLRLGNFVQNSWAVIDWKALEDCIWKWCMLMLKTALGDTADRAGQLLLLRKFEKAND